MTGTLIIGYEPTEQGEDALALGQELAELLAAKPLVATVLPWPRNLISAEDLERALRTDTATMFAVVRDRLQRLDPETRAIAERSPAEALQELAEDVSATAIVLGSCHRGALGRVLLGSVGESLLHGAPCVVAVAPRGFATGERGPMARIGVGFDGSAEGWAALETAIGIAERLHASVTVLSVAEPQRYSYAEAFPVLTAAQLHNHERDEKRRLLELAAARAPQGLSVDSRLLSGPPGPALADSTPQLDLIVCGSRGYGPLRRTALGSTAAALIRRSSCPVMVLPRAAGLDPLGLGARAPGRRQEPAIGASGG